MLEEHTLLTVCVSIIGDKIQRQQRLMPLTLIGESNPIYSLFYCCFALHHINIQLAYLNISVLSYQNNHNDLVL